MYNEKHLEMRNSFLLICTLLLISCASQKKQTESQPGFNEISFGSGGGFTGSVNKNMLNKDGKVYKMIDGKPEKINRIKKPEINDISEFIKIIDFKNIKISDKGNFTYFIEIETNGLMNRTTWTDSSQAPELKELYKKLVKTLTK